MEVQYIIAMLVTLTAVASYVNHRFLQLPKSIGLTLLTLLLSTSIMLFTKLGYGWVQPYHALLSSVDFSHAVMNGMLSFLLFASALHISYIDLARYRNMIAWLATASVVISCLIIGYVLWWVSHFLGLAIPLGYCLLFGALIAPTDAIAVLGVFKRVKAPASVRIKISGEALFNDAVGIFLFFLILGFATGNMVDFEWHTVAMHFISQGFGGIAAGLVMGTVVAYLMRKADDPEVVILITLAVATGGYVIANAMGFSGPICMVVIGLIVGSQCRQPRFTERTVKGMDNFWGLVDDVLNAFLFVLIGLEILTIDVNIHMVLLGCLTFFIVLFARYISVAWPMFMMGGRKHFSWRVSTVMTWGGMRGGISIALALSIPGNPANIITITYMVVLISIIFQGLTMQPLMEWGFKKRD